MNTAEVSNDVDGAITTLYNSAASAPPFDHDAVPDLPNELIFKIIAIVGHEYLDAEVLDASPRLSLDDACRIPSILKSLLRTLLDFCLAGRILRQEALRYVWRRVRVMDKKKRGQWGMTDSRLSTLFSRRLLDLFPLISRTNTSNARCASLTSVLPYIKELSIEIYRAYGKGERDSPADRFGSGALLEVLKIFSSTSNASGPQGCLEKLTFIFDVYSDPISFMDLPRRFQRVFVSLIRSMRIPFTPPRNLEVIGIYGIPLELFLDEGSASSDCSSVPRLVRLLTSREKLSHWMYDILDEGTETVQDQGDDPDMRKMWRQLGVKFSTPDLGGVIPMVNQERPQVDSESSCLANPVEALETDFETLNWGNTENMERLLKSKFYRLKEFLGVIWNSQALQKMNHLLSGASTSLEVVQIALAVSQGTVSKIYVLPSLRNLSFSLYYSLKNPYTYLYSWERHNKGNPAMDMILNALGHGQTDAHIGSPLESFRLAVYWNVYEYRFHSYIFGETNDSETHWKVIDDVLSSNLYPELASVSLVIVIELSNPRSEHSYTEPTFAEVYAEKKSFEQFGPKCLIEKWFPKLRQKEQDTQGGFSLSVVYSTEYV